MATVALSPDFTDRVLGLVLSHHRDRVLHLTERQERFMVTSCPKFVFPFGHSVVQGLVSGERHENFLLRLVRYASCRQAMRISYEDDYGIVRERQVKEAVQDVFRTHYSLGIELGDVKNLRNERGVVDAIGTEEGTTLVYMATDGLSINVEDRRVFARETWRQYAGNMTPRTFNF